MHATRESRKEGGRYYTKCLERPRICVGKKNMEYVWRNTVYVNFDVDRIILQDTGSATTLAWDGVNALKLLFKELQGAKHVHVLSDNLHYLDMILKLVNVEKFTVLPILETETEEDMHRALSQRLRFRGFTSSDRFKAWELDIEIEHKRAPEEVGLEPCAADRKIIVNDIDRKTLG
jgi:DNA-binding protein